MSAFRRKSRLSTNTLPCRSAFRRSAFWRSRFTVRVFAVGISLSATGFSAIRAHADTPTLGGGAVSAASTSLDSQNGQRTDIVFGRNVKGPYMLSWRGLRPGSEVVTRDGVLLKRDTDYTFDPVTGSLSFPNLIGPSQIIRVSYSADTIDSKLNVSTLALPLQWTLWSQNKSSLTFNTLYNPNDPNSNSALVSNLQFLDTTQLARTSSLSSGVYFDLHGGDWLARSGAKFAEQTKMRYLDLGASYSYAGALFGKNDASGLTAGKEIMQANGAFNPLKNLKFTGLIRETNQLLDTSNLAAGSPTRGTQTLESVQSLSLTLPQRGQIDASRAVTNVTDANGDSVATTTDAVKVQRQIVNNTTASVGYEAQTIIPTSAIQGEEKALGTYTQKTSVDVRSSPLKQVNVTGSFRSTLGGVNAGDSESVRVEATPFASMKQLKITTGYEDIYQEAGVQRKREALVDLPQLAFGRTQLSGGIQQIDNIGKEQYVGIVNAKSSPIRYLQLDGGAKLRQGTLADNVTPDPDVVNTFKFKFALAPSRFFKLTGDMAHNPEGDGGIVQHTLKQTIGLESDWGLFLFKGQYGTENAYQTANRNSLLNVGVDLRLTKFDTLSTGFEGRSQYDSNVTSTNTYRLGYTHRLGSAFDLSLSGSYTQTMLNGLPSTDKPELRTEAKVGLKF